MTDFLNGVEVIEVEDGLRPVRTVRSAVIGVVGTAPNAVAAKFPLNVPVLLAGNPRLAVDLGTTGTLPDAVRGIYDQAGAMVVVIRVEAGADHAATVTNVIGDAAGGTGIHALTAAQATVGVVPKILVAPGFTGARSPGPPPGPNPVVSGLLGIAGRLRAIVVADGPNTNDADALAYAGDFGSPRLFIVDPHVRVWDAATSTAVPRPASPRVAGVIARTDAERGFWWSPSNQEVFGIAGIDRPVDLSLSDASSAGQVLNAGNVANIARIGGFRLWGNRTTATDPMWAFLSVRRTADMVYESLEWAMLWAMARPFSAQLLLDVQETVQGYLTTLVGRGALLGGRVWIDPALNSQADLMAGKLTVDFDLEPPAPLERLTLRAHREGAYYTELVADVAA